MPKCPIRRTLTNGSGKFSVIPWQVNDVVFRRQATLGECANVWGNFRPEGAWRSALGFGLGQRLPHLMRAAYSLSTSMGLVR